MSSDKEILALEDKRYAAMCDGDFAALEPMLHDELLYTHTSGLTDTKATWQGEDAQPRWVHQQVSRKALTGGVQAVGLSPPMSCRNPKLVPTVWRVFRSHPQGREATRPAGAGAEQVR